MKHPLARGLLRSLARAVPVMGGILEELLQAEDSERLATEIVARLRDETIVITAEESSAASVAAAWSVLDLERRRALEARAGAIEEIEDPGERLGRTQALATETLAALRTPAGEGRRSPAELVATGDVVDGRYEILGRLGRGGFGVVYRARDLRLDTLCAIKVLRARGDEFEQRFRREAQIGNRLGKVRQVVRAFDLGEVRPGLLYMALDLVEGAEPLELDPEELEEGLENLASAAEALAEVHEQEVIHRDLKPENFLVTEDEVYLIDFGLARDLEEEEKLSIAGPMGVRGTPAYMAPEQIEDFSSADKSSDIFSLGVMLFGLLTGQRKLGARPWERWEPEDFDDELPDGLVQLCLSALEEDPEDRPESAEDFAEELHEAIDKLFGAPDEDEDEDDEYPESYEDDEDDDEEDESW